MPTPSHSMSRKVDTVPACPLCSEEKKVPMVRMTDGEILRLLFASVPLLDKMATAGNPRLRVKGFRCRNCRFIALFEKRPGEP